MAESLLVRARRTAAPHPRTAFANYADRVPQFSAAHPAAGHEYRERTYQCIEDLVCLDDRRALSRDESSQTHQAGRTPRGVVARGTVSQSGQRPPAPGAVLSGCRAELCRRTDPLADWNALG